MSDIDAIRERLQQEDYDADAWETNGYAQVLFDAERLLAALDKASDKSWDSEEYANRMHTALCRLSKRVTALKAERDAMLKVLREIKEMHHIQPTIVLTMVRDCLAQIKGESDGR